MISVRKAGSVIARNKSEEYVAFSIFRSGEIDYVFYLSRDEAQISKLQNLGMTSSDEAKLLAMRDYILKLANATSR